jgi:subtilisin-like proprotein convertase family protein
MANNCWGHIRIEDKYGPQLECSDVFTTCVGDLTPGSPMSDRINIPGFSADNILLPGAPNSKTFTIPVTGFSDINISNIGVHLNISHTRVSDLVATVKAPDGNMVTLFVSPGANAGPCTGDNVLVDIFDDAANSSADLLNMCNLVAPAVTGEFRPTSPLSIFDNINADGNWEITIHDISNGEGGVINDVTLSFDQEGSTIPFPYPFEVNWIDLGNNSYWIENGDNCTSATLSYTDQIVQQGCQGEYLRVIRRCWTGTDEFNNNANGCCQTIYVYRNGLSAINFPPDYDDIDEPALSCEDFGDDVPGLDDTGTVTGDFCDNIQIVPYTDVIIPICKRSYKIIRTHKVIEWCNSLVLEHNQIIKVLDKKGPELQCPADVTVSANTHDCFATLTLDQPEIVFDCSDEFNFKLEHAFGPFNAQFPCREAQYSSSGVIQNTNTITGFPIGTSFIRWTVEDECENFSTCCSRITVRDDVRPTAVCHDFTVVSIAANKEALVNVESFDDGSHDNCAIKEIAVRKMTNKCLSGNTNFGPQALFCCAEIGEEIMVEMRVTDIYNNTNTCMVRASVQDKLPPYIKCPVNVTLDCQADYDDPDLTFEPVAVDNCSVKEVFKEDDPFLSQCGTGYIHRVWTAVDFQDLKHSCTQTITLIDYEPFNEYDIYWPENYETNKCGAALLPENLPDENSYPDIYDDECSLIGVHYKDQVFTFVDGACEKILRTWTVLDWCTYNENNPVIGQGWYEHVQIIKMHNDSGPVFETPCVERTYYSFGECEGEVSESVQVSDSCTPQEQIVVKYYIDVFNNGSVQFEGTAKSYTRILPDGTHKIRWTAEDRCGNLSVCEYLIHVEDGKKPTPYCLSSITTAVMNSNGRIEIWARDYDLGSKDNCTEDEDLWFTFFGAKPVKDLIDEDHYFKGNGLGATVSEYIEGTAQKWLHADRTSGIMFTCDDIPNGISENVSLDMSVTDEEGNSDYCTITLVLQDNSDFCEDQEGNVVSVSGRVTLADSRPLTGATIVMNSNQPEFPKTQESAQTGTYQFSGIKKNFDYNLSAQLNNRADAGVSTLDLVLIQRHILGVSTFNNPYNCIAADIDANEKINTVDLVNLRKVILGTYSEFPNGQKSWRFVPTNAQFADMNSPWPLTEKYNYTNLAQNKSNQNFIGVKIGDVNNSIVLNVAGDPVESRSVNTLTFKTSEVKAAQNEVIRVPVYVEGYNDVLGYQFTAQFDPALFRIINVEPGVMNVNSDNIGIFNEHPGKVTMSWNSVMPVTISPDEVAFYWILETKKDILRSALFDVNSEITSAEGVDAEFRILKINTGIKGNSISADGVEFEVKQNVPNPFSAQTTISFTIPAANDVVIKIHDVSGKEMYMTKTYFEAGTHDVKIDKQILGKSGIYYYQVSSGEFTGSKKMVVIE